MKKILIISPTPTHPQNAGNRARVYKLSLLLKRYGNEVYFAYIDFERADIKGMRLFWGDKFIYIPYKNRVNSFWLRISRKINKVLQVDEFRRKIFFKGKYGIDDWYDNNIDNLIKPYLHKHKFDVVLVEYVYFSSILENFDAETLKILDTHDVYTDRDLKFTLKGFLANNFYTTRAQEAKGLSRADVILAIQPKEKIFFDSITDKKVIVVGHPVEIRLPSYPKPHRNKLLFVGSRHESNVIGIEYFLKKIFPKIIQSIRDVELFIVGRVGEKIKSYEQCKNIGEVADLKTVYEQADVVISPILMGTGLKIKNIEAISYAKPLVTTSIGAEGLEEGIGTAFMVGDTAEEFASNVIKLLTDDEVYKFVTYEAHIFAEKYNQTVFRELAIVLSEF